MVATQVFHVYVAANNSLIKQVIIRMRGLPYDCTAKQVVRKITTTRFIFINDTFF